MQKSILLVDDEPMLREVLEERLNDIILSDIKMPVMDGASFIKEARGSGYNQPILFFSAFASHAIMDAVTPYGVTGFLDKCKIEDLEGALLSALNQCDNSEKELNHHLNKL